MAVFISFNMSPRLSLLLFAPLEQTHNVHRVSFGTASSLAPTLFTPYPNMHYTNVEELEPSPPPPPKKKTQAFEENIGNWTAFRPTFNRLSVNVTAFFGVAPVNSTDPGLDAHPPPPGVSVSLAKLEEADPIFDEEGDAGGLPEYNPLKFGEGKTGR